MDEASCGCADISLVADLKPQMPFVKKVKSDAYFSRFQVKYRRRREGKTDCTLLCPTHKVPIVMFRLRLRAQAVSGAGKKQVVSRRS
jgi:hypothetical protein